MTTPFRLKMLLTGQAQQYIKMLLCELMVLAIFVKPQQWPTPSESIAIYCIRKLVSHVTHLQSSNNRLQS